MNDELRRAISIAQTAHDRNDGPADATAVSIGALIRAVTILAGEQPTSRDEAINVYKETRDAAIRAFGETSSAEGSVSGDLVKGLIETFVHGTKDGVLSTGEGVRAILSELASASIELPSQSQIVQAMRDEIRGWGPEKAVEFTRKRIAHFLAAKDIEIKEAKSEIESLKSRLVEQSARESRLHVVLSDHGLPTGPKALATELTNRAKATEEDARRIDSLVRESVAIRSELDGDLSARIALLRANSVPPTVDGKTPGEFGYGIWYPLCRQGLSIALRDWKTDVSERDKQIWETTCAAVLRAFGQPSQTTQTNATEVLNKLASYWEKGAAYEGMPEQYRRGLKDCAKELREKLANISAEPPSDATTPKFFANENEIRGTYFCTAITLRPYLHVGHDVEFDDIPRILKLGRNDVIEVRVVERAER